MSNRARTNLMTEGDFRKKIVLFAIPVFLGQLFQQLYNTADSLIVGNFLGSNALAAVSSTGSLIYLLIGFFMGFSMGAGVVIGRHIGAKRIEEIEKSVHTTVAMGLVFSVLVSVIGVSMAKTFLTWMQTPMEVLPDATTYLRIYFGGSFSLIMYNTFVGILQASGDSKHPLFYLIASSIINIILDILFIGVLHMGVEGAAFATVLSQCISMLLALFRLLRTSEAIRITPSKIAFDMPNLTQIIRFGLPTALQGTAIDLGNILIQSYINSFGNFAMAGIGAYSKIEGFIFLPVSAFGMATTTFVSQNIGAKQIERTKQGIRFGTACSLILTAVIGVLIFIFAPVLIAAFDRNPMVIAYGVQRARIVSLFFFLLGFANTTSAVLRGLGKPIIPMVTMLVCWCGVRVAVILTIGQVVHDIALTGWLYPITWGLSCIVFLFYYRRIDWNQLSN